MVQRIYTKFVNSNPNTPKACACLIMCNAVQVCTCQRQTLRVVTFWDTLYIATSYRFGDISTSTAIVYVTTRDLQ